MSVCGHNCGCSTPCDKPVTMEELLDVWEEQDSPHADGEDVLVSDLVQRVKERRMGL